MYLCIYIGFYIRHVSGKTRVLPPIVTHPENHKMLFHVFRHLVHVITLAPWHDG